jgi:RNA polymerase sigma-70 factor (ECF subfamily)
MPESFEAFFEAEHARLFGLLCVVSGRRSDAEELMQEAFVRVWERWDWVRNHPSPSGYLYRTALNLARSRARKAFRTARRPLVRSEHSDDELAMVEDRDSLVRALRRLPVRQRAAIVLTEAMDLSAAEAGVILAVKPATVRALTFQARNALRKLMEDDHD